MNVVANSEFGPDDLAARPEKYLQDCRQLFMSVTFEHYVQVLLRGISLYITGRFLLNMAGSLPSMRMFGWNTQAKQAG